jgi:hypothetical protein
MSSYTLPHSCALSKEKNVPLRFRSAAGRSGLSPMMSRQKEASHAL